VGEMINAYIFLLGKLEVMRPLGRPCCKMGDNIKIVLKEIGCTCVDGICLV
jgi:hypothetical protein